MCIDYKALNANIITNAYPIPCIDNILDYLGYLATFSQIDLTKSYYHVQIAKGHQYRTAFQMCFGLLEYHVFLFGLYSAPAIFQRLMNKIL